VCVYYGRPLRPRLDRTSGPSARYGHSTMLTPGSSPERVGTWMLTGVLEVLVIGPYMFSGFYVPMGFRMM
jgi:hypothetical protein